MKNLKYLLLILSLFPLFLFAQEDVSKFRLELSTQSIFNRAYSLKKSLEREYRIVGRTYNYGVHLSAFWDLGKRLDLGIGFGFASRDAYVQGVCPNCLNPGGIFERPVYGPGTLLRSHSLEIPLELRWKWLKTPKRWAPYTSFGLTGHIPVKYKQVVDKKEAKLDASYGSLGVQLGLGCSVTLFEKWTLIMATYGEKNNNFKFEPASNSSSHRVILDEWGLKFGVGRRF